MVSRMASPWSSTAGDGAELLDDSGEHQWLLRAGWGHGEADVGLLASMPVAGRSRR